MSALAFGLVVWLVIVGLLGIARSRDMLHVVMCLSIVQSATYVLLLEVGYRVRATAPIFKDIPSGTRAVDPVVQALVLADVVVGVTVTALLVSIALRAYRDTGTVDPDELHPMRG